MLLRGSASGNTSHVLNEKLFLEPTDGEWIPDNMEYPGFYGYDSAALTDESMNSTDF